MPRWTPRCTDALAATLLLATAPAGALSEFGIEGMHVVSTGADEVRASVSPDGRHIVWASPDRPGGPGGGDLWQATLREGRWSDATPLALDTAARESDPAFSADGRWLYFASDRPGGAGGDDLYRAPVAADGTVGAAQPLAGQVNGPGNDTAPMPSRDGRHLLFASDRSGAAGVDLFVARRMGEAFVTPVALAGTGSPADEIDGAWLDDGQAMVFTRVTAGNSLLLLAQCAGGHYVDAAPLPLSFNVPGQRTRGAMPDWHAPGELLVSGIARAPRAGGSDIYRMRAPRATGSADCIGEGAAPPPAQRASRSQRAASSAK